MRLQSGSLILDGRAKQDAVLGNSVVEVAPEDIAVVALPTIHDIKKGKQKYSGRMELKILFGKQPSRLTRYYRTEGTFDIALTKETNNTFSGIVNSTIPVTEYGRV
jgi:hypothetical protein